MTRLQTCTLSTIDCSAAGNVIPMLVNKVRLLKGDKLLVSKVAAGDKDAEEVKPKAGNKDEDEPQVKPKAKSKAKLQVKPKAKSKAKNKDEDEPQPKKAKS
jgi:hypothetical protein